MYSVFPAEIFLFHLTFVGFLYFYLQLRPAAFMLFSLQLSLLPR